MSTKNIYFFLAGIIFSQKLIIIGELYIGELFLGILLIFNIKQIYLPIEHRRLAILLIVWFAAQLLSDLVNQTDLIKSIKGVLAPVFILIIFLGLNSLLRRHSLSIPYLLCGVFLGILVNKISYGSEYFLLNQWKWGIGLSLSLIFFTLLEFYWLEKRNLYLKLGGALLVILSLANSSRSLALIVLVSVTLVHASKFLPRLVSYRYFSTIPSGGLQLFIVLLITMFFIDNAISFVFTYPPFLELLPPKDALKYSKQAMSDWGILLGGRSEWIISLQAFLDAPLLGHGSWAEDKTYVFKYLKLVDSAGSSLYSLEVMKKNIQSLLIPTHSHIMSALVWGGAFAGLFWLYILKSIFGGFLKPKTLASPLLVFSSIYLLWNILFSPFGADARWLSTFLIWLYFNFVKIRSVNGVRNI